MKFIAILSAFLIAANCFGQDLIEYQDFKFYQNGSEISFEEVTELTKEYGVARVVFWQGRRDYAASESTLRAIRINLTYGALTVSGGQGAFVGLAFWIFEEDFGWSMVYIASASVSAWGAYYFLRLLATKKKFRERADKKFQKTSQKLNEAIQLGKSQ